MSTAAGILASFATSTIVADLPEDVGRSVKLHLLDTLGCAIGAAAMGVGTSPRTAMLDLHGDGPATVVGTRRRLPAPAAACANGTMAHALEFDDTHSAAIANVGAFVAPAALAAAQHVGASGADLLVSLAVGSEIVVRLGLAAAPSFLVSGFHPAAICGTFGATAASARLLGLDLEQSTDALAIAGSMASGIYEHFSDGSSTKMLHAGWTGQSGVMAALLARAGMDGPGTVLEGPFGVFHSHFRLSGEAVDAQLSDLGTRWEVLRTSIKPYPVCYMSLSPLDAVRAAVGGRTFEPRDIRQVRVSIPVAGVPIVLEPRASKLLPRTRFDAQFSLPYVLAAMLVDGRVDLRTFEEPVMSDPRIREIACRVVGIGTEFPTFPASYPAAVEVETTDGSVMRAQLDHEPGGAESPLASDAVRAKFRTNAGMLLADDLIGQIEDRVLGLEHEARLDDLARLLEG